MLECKRISNKAISIISTMIEAILGAALAYLIYKNLMATHGNPDPKLAGARGPRPTVPYATMASLNLNPHRKLRLAGTRTDMGRVGTPRMELVDEYTGQRVFAYANSTSRLGNYNI